MGSSHFYNNFRNYILRERFLMKRIKLGVGLCLAIFLISSLAAPTLVYAQDETPTATPDSQHASAVTDSSPVPTDALLVATDEAVATAAPIDLGTSVEATSPSTEETLATPEPTAEIPVSLTDITAAIVDQAAAITRGDPSGVLGAGAYGAPAGAVFHYYKADGVTYTNGECTFDSGSNVVTCYWDLPIQTAINDAAVGSTVSVEAGDYTEQVEISKDLTLQAAVGVTIHSPSILTTGFTSTRENKPIIYVTGANNVNLTGFVIDGGNLGDFNSRFVGIAFYNAGGTISNNTILGITETSLSFDQQGVGILVLNDDGVARTVTISGNEVSDYQKTGIEVLGSGLTASIADNTVTGSGTTPLTAQNGIEVGGGAAGNISGNEISANDFSGSGYTATGILEVGPSTGWTIENNYLHENQTNLYLHEGNNIDVSGNIIVGGTWGVVASSDTTGSLTATISNNTITANSVGVYVDDPNVTFLQNNITGNTTGLWFNDTKSSGGTIDASQNYWGCVIGANTPGCDTTVGSVNTGSPLASEVIQPPLDRTLSNPLGKPNPATSTPRYLSGFGSDNSFTIFYEDRKLPCSGAYGIVFNQTTSGPEGLSSTSTATDMCDSHLIVKDWPFTFGGNTYAYRAWGAGTYSGVHNLWGSNDLTHWTKVSAFTIPTNNSIVDSQILYGFHDVVQINNHYLGFAETAGGFTVIVESPDGLNDWTVVSLVGGSNPGNGPLNLLSSSGPKPTGNFVLITVNGQLVYAKLMVPGDKRAAYLAINAAAAQAANPALAEAAFENPANWTWMDGTTGVPGVTNAYFLSSYTSGGHYIGEEWMIPNSDLDAKRVIIYDAEYARGVTGLGCAADNPGCLATDSSVLPDGGAVTVPGSFTSLELNPQIIPTEPVPTPVIPPVTISSLFIPVTGGEFINLSCQAATTLELEDGIKLTFNAPLCEYAASLNSELETTLPASLPSGDAFKMGATYQLRFGDSAVKVLPVGISATLSFPKPADLTGTPTIIFWDVNANNGTGAWVELPKQGALSTGDNRVVIQGLFEQDGRMFLVTNFTGTFILVNK
jgi:hypothetical protein